MKPVHAVIIVLLCMVGYLAWKRWGTVIPGQAKRVGGSGVLKDPCPGDDTVWDADLERCVPLKEEPLPDWMRANYS